MESTHSNRLRVRVALLGLSLSLGSLACASPASADIIDSISDHGIYLNGSGSYQTQHELIVVGSAWWGLNSQWNQAVAGLEFDTTQTVLGRQTLMLRDTGSGGDEATQLFDLYGYIGDGTVTPEDRLNTTLALGTFQTSSSGGWNQIRYYLDVTDFVNQRIASGDRYAGFLIKGAHSNAFEAFGFIGHIETQAIPEPTTTALLACVGLGLSFFRRRR